MTLHALGGPYPERWRTVRSRFIARLNPSKRQVARRPANTPVSFVPMEAVGEWGGLDTSACRSLGDVQNGYTFFRDGDVLVAKITPCFENGKGALAQGLLGGFGFGTTELHVVSPSRDLDPRFLFYVTISHPFRRLGQGEMFGAGGQKRVPESFLLDFPIGLPTRSEQSALVSFLDRKTPAIDALIAKKERLIELLQEKRQALITQAVTKGLDPNVPMKESGIEWLGRIPTHWGAMPLKHAVLEVIDCKNRTPEYFDDGAYGVVRTSNVKGGQFVTEDLLRTNEREYHVWTQRGIPRSRDVMFTREAPAGEACFVPESPPVCLGQRMMLFRLGRHLLDPDFVLFSIYGPQVQEFIAANTQGSTVHHLRVDQVRNLPFLVPPAEEQRLIGAFLRASCRRFDVLTDLVKVHIEKLREHRQALITAAVTGKIDVAKEAA